MEIRLRFRGDMMISIGFSWSPRAVAANGGEAAIRGGLRRCQGFDSFRCSAEGLFVEDIRSGVCQLVGWAV
jgi:hypothetical protein